MYQKAEMKNIMVKHMAFMAGERQVYMDHQFQAKDRNNIWSIAMDGADQSAHDIPKVMGRVPKDLMSSTWPQKLQCVVAHGDLLAMFSVLPLVLCGGNMALTCLLRIFQLLAAAGCGCPKKLYLQVDGGSENWCIALFAVLDLLFDLYPDLDEIVVSRLGVGHTHIDIDRFFSYLNALLFGTSAGGSHSGASVLCPTDFEALFNTAMKSKKDTKKLDHVYEQLNFTYDWKGFLGDHFYKGFTGYGSAGAVHVMKYHRQTPYPAPPHVSYKYWHQSPKWLPADGSSLRILSTRPDLRDLNELKVCAFIDDHAAVVTKLKMPTMKWVSSQVPYGLVKESHVADWKAFFDAIPKTPTATFGANFPDNRRFNTDKVLIYIDIYRYI